MRRVVAALVLATVALYLPHVWRAGYVYEDGHQLQNVPAVLQVGDFVPRLHPEGLQVALIRATYASERAPVVHLVSLALHLVAGGLVGLLAWQLFGLPWVGVYAAGVFWLHPFQVEAVAYGAAQMAQWVTVGVLVAAVALSERTTVPRAVVALVALALAAWIKPTVVAGLPIVLALGWRHWTPLGRAVCVGLAALLVAWLRPMALLGRLLETDVLHSAWRWMLIQSTLAASYAWQAVWPFGLSLDPDVDLWPAAVLVGSVAALVGLTVAAWRVRGKWPVVTVGWLWFVVALVPRIVVRQHEVMHAHHAYLAFAGLAMIGGWLLAGAPRLSVGGRTV